MLILVNLLFVIALFAKARAQYHDPAGYLDGYNLTRIPNGEGLENLSFLSLSRNMISSIEAHQLSWFKGLRELDVSKNRIEFLTNDSFPPNSTLLTLNMAANQIEILESGSLDGLVFLTNLNLSKNKIKTISRDTFSPLKSLEELDLSRNKLELMDSLRFQELKKLRVLNLRRNHMSNLSDAAFFGLDNIQNLYLDGNNIKMVEKRWLYGLKSLLMLNLSRNDMTGIDDVWEFCEELEILDLSWNQLTGLTKSTFIGLSKLRLLDLSSNQIVEIEEESFSPLEKLMNLDLSNNQLSWALEDMSGPFNGLTDCQVLNLASNQIRSLHPQALDGLTSLHTLNLSSNPLTILSETPFQSIHFVGFHLILKDVSTLVCDCESEWLRNLYVNSARVSHSPRIRHREDRKSVKKNLLSTILMNSPICAHPPELKGKLLSDASPNSLICLENSPRPAVIEEPKTQVFLMDGNGSLSCNVRSSSSFPLRVSWRKDHQELSKLMDAQVNNLERTVEDGVLEVNSTLELVNVTSSIAGRFQCVAENSLGVVYSEKANVTVHIFPTFLKKPANITVRLGKNAKLECAAKGLPTPEIAFQKDGGEDFPAALDRRFHVMPNDDSFFIMEVKLSDSGVYCCSGKNAAGEIKACAAVVVYETPSFVDLMEDENAVEGSNAILQCSAAGSPQPQITWNRDGIVIGSILPGSKYRLSENGSLLIIKNVEVGDGGRYECFLSNAVGTARGFSHLNVVPNTGNRALSLDTSSMTIFFIIIAVFCVVVTSAAWVVVIYRTRKRTKSVLHERYSSGEGAPLRHPFGDISIHAKFEETEEGVVFGGQPLPSHGHHHHLNKLQCGDGGSVSSSGKDISLLGGDDCGTEGDPLNIPDAEEEEALMRRSRRRKHLESFSTFGGTRTTRLSSNRLDFSNSDIGDVISLSHNPGREFGRKVACPTVPHLSGGHLPSSSTPSHGQLPHQRLFPCGDTLQIVPSGGGSSSAASGTSSTSSSESKSSSSGYASSIILPKSHLARTVNERNHSTNSSESLEVEGTVCGSPDLSSPPPTLDNSSPALLHHNSTSISTQV